jgi:hypothetical protein
MIDFDRRLGIARAERGDSRSGTGFVFEFEDPDKCDGARSFYKENKLSHRGRRAMRKQPLVGSLTACVRMVRTAYGTG